MLCTFFPPLPASYNKQKPSTSYIDSLVCNTAQPIIRSAWSDVGTISVTHGRTNATCTGFLCVCAHPQGHIHLRIINTLPHFTQANIVVTPTSTDPPLPLHRDLPRLLSWVCFAAGKCLAFFESKTLAVSNASP